MSNSTSLSMVKSIKALSMVKSIIGIIKDKDQTRYQTRFELAHPLICLGQILEIFSLDQHGYYADENYFYLS